mgnify:CR=1 FL=1
MTLAGLGAEVRAWAPGRSWVVRAPVLLWLGWLLTRYWDDRTYFSIWHGINLGFHEAGHALFSYFGWLLGVAGGTILEVAIPIIAAAMLYRQRDWFGVAVAVCWLGIVCFEVATYANDANRLRLPLVSPWGNPGPAGHDWANILRHFGVLPYAQRVAGVWEGLARLFMLGGLAFGAWTLWLMARSKGVPTDPALADEGRRFLEHAGRR